MTAKSPTLSLMFSSPAHLFSLGFGAGLAPFAPGTFGTLVGYPVFLVMAPVPLVLKTGLYLILFFLGCWLCGKTGDALGKHDHSAIVWDEIVAMAIILEFTPAHWVWWVIAFLLFRLFDILKPWPISLADNAHGNGVFVGGFFVMLDDILAAFYAIAVIFGLLFFIRVWF
jgi:phosphatidylglycerophosphatase A